MTDIYAYVGNDPLNLTYPSGLCTSSLSGCASSALSLLGTTFGIGHNSAGARMAETVASRGAATVAGAVAGAVVGVVGFSTPTVSGAQEAANIFAATGSYH